MVRRHGRGVRQADCGRREPLSAPHDWLDDLRVAWVADPDRNPIRSSSTGPIWPLTDLPAVKRGASPVRAGSVSAQRTREQAIEGHDCGAPDPEGPARHALRQFALKAPHRCRSRSPHDNVVRLRGDVERQVDAVDDASALAHDLELLGGCRHLAPSVATEGPAEPDGTPGSSTRCLPRPPPRRCAA